MSTTGFTPVMREKSTPIDNKYKSTPRKDDKFLAKSTRDNLSKNWKLNKDLQNMKFDYDEESGTKSLTIADRICAT